ncbi:thiamine-phosphate kinase [Candidatus Pelagibacter sp.]|uniref:thiamine-phosphate kinase n=1 Tax=Candidatus Pelagibacter sp. TaxID=2024849 RepID=UPI003F863C3F
MHEFDLINNYFFNIAKKNKSALNLNDDVFFDKKKGVVISVDTYNIGTHFYDFKSPDLVIKKILRSSISDLICKGVIPKFYFISGSGNKKTFTKNNLYKISKSLKSEQNKFNIDLCGGDTTLSNKLSFTITSLGYSNKIIYRNKAKLNDDIYVTGNLGDSFLGLKALSNKVKFKNKDKLFFINKYYKPELPLNLTKYLLKFANCSIDVSDGLIDDLAKMINRQSLSFHLFENKIPVSSKLSNYVKKQRLNKVNLISNGDDYQVLFTADIKKARIIKKVSKTTGIKITKIGKIVSGKDRSLIFDEKGKQIRAKSKGYIHRF